MNKFLVWAIAFGAMVFWLPMNADPYMTPRLLLVAAASAGLLFLRSDKRSSLEKPAFWMLAAFFLCAALSHDRAYSFIGSYLLGIDSLLAVICYAEVLKAGARADDGVEGVADAVVAMSIPVSLYGIFQRFFPDPLIWGELHGGHRVASTQGGPIWLGAVMAISILCALYRARAGSRTAYAALVLGLPCLWFTETRGAVLAVGVGAVFTFRWLALAAIPALLLMPRFSMASLSDATRLEVWNIAVRVFVDNPIVGYGNGNFYLAFRRYTDWTMVRVAETASYVQAHAHNDFLHVAATMGIVGLIAYCILYASVVRVAIKHAERGFLLSLIGAYAVLSAFNPVTTSAFVMLALVFGAASSKVEPVTERRTLPALASMLVAIFVGRLVVADYHYGRGALAKDNPQLAAMEFQRAAQLNPWEVFYSCRRVDSVTNLIPYMPLKDRRALALATRQMAADVVLLHPMDSYAHELMGKQIIIAYMAGYRDIDPRDSLKSFNRAQELAPTFEMLLWRRRNAAIVLQDAEQAEYANRDIGYLRAALAGGRKS